MENRLWGKLEEAAIQAQDHARQWAENLANPRKSSLMLKMRNSTIVRNFG